MSLQYLTAGQWVRRPARALLTVLSVAIAVTAVLGTSLSQSTVRRAYREMSRTLEGPPALEIVAAEGGRFGASEISSLTEVEGVTGVLPVVCEKAKARVNGKPLRTLVVGLDTTTDPRAWNQIKLSEGRPCRAANEVVISQTVAASLHVELGTRVTFFTRRGLLRFATVVGLADARSMSDLTQGATMILPAKTVHRWFAIEGELDRIRVVLDETADRGVVQRQIAERLPPELAVQTPSGQMVLAESMLLSTELALQFAGIMSLVMAGFIILNTLRMNFSERRRQLATLRALGATRRQVGWLLVTEGLWIGLAGSLLGIPGGLGLALSLARVMQGLLRVEHLPTVWPRWDAMLLAVASGPVVAVLAACLPAFQSRRISPIDEMSEGGSLRVDRFRLFAISLAPLAGAISGGMSWLIISHRLPPAAAIPAFVMLLLAFLALLPLVVRPLVRTANWALARCWGIEGRLASEQLVRRPTRTGLTAGVLVIAITTGLGLGNAIIDNVEDARSWYQRSFTCDFVLSNSSASEAPSLEENQQEQKLLGDLAEQAGVGNVVSMRFLPVRAMNSPAMCVVRDFLPDEAIPWTADKAQEAEIRARLAEGDIVLASVLAHRLQLAKGDTIRLDMLGRVVSFHVGAVVNDYNQGGMVAFLDRRGIQATLDLGPIEYLMIQGRKGADPFELEAALQRFAGDRGLVLQSFAGLRSQFDGLINGIVVSLWSLLVLGFVVGGFAVANTLTMSVLEQTREFGLLRIVGMTRRQVRKMVLCEAALLSGVGLLTGSLAGIATALLIYVCNEALTQRQVPFLFHFWLLGANIVACLLVAVLSAWLPSRRATRLDLLEAIAYE